MFLSVKKISQSQLGKYKLFNAAPDKSRGLWQFAVTPLMFFEKSAENPFRVHDPVRLLFLHNRIIAYWSYHPSLFDQARRAVVHLSYK